MKFKLLIIALLSTGLFYASAQESTEKVESPEVEAIEPILEEDDSDPLAEALAEGDADLAAHDEKMGISSEPSVLDGLFPSVLTVGQNGSLTTGAWNFSFGNGNEHKAGSIGGWGYVSAHDGYVTHLSIGARTRASNATKVVVTINGKDSAAFIEVTGKALKGFVRLKEPLKIVAGDSVNFRTVTPGGADDVVLTATLFLNIKK